MRKLLPLVLLLGCTDPSSPESIDGTYRMESVEYRTPRLRQWCDPCASDFRLTLGETFLEGNGQRLTISSQSLQNPVVQIAAYLPEVGRYDEQGDSVLVEAFGNQGPVGWARGMYAIEGGRLVKDEVVTSGDDVIYTLRVVWVRE